MGKVETLKYLSAVIIGICTLAGLWMPMCFRAQKWTSRAESLAGGVFLGAGLAHLLAEGYESIEEAYKGNKYPIAPAVCLSTFVLLTCIDLFSYGEHDEEFQVETTKEELLASLLDGTQSIIGEEASLATQANESKFGTGFLSVPILSIYIIMDVHSIIEGVALGILDGFTKTLAIFFAIIGHKPVEAFALGLILLKDRPKKSVYWTLCIIYSLLTPIGIVAAMWIAKKTGHGVRGIISSFSAGTFLFVGCHEWGEMFKHKQEWGLCEKAWHYLMFTSGIVWMLLIAIIEAVYGE
jgi:zinc transporter 1/2/3